MATTYARLADLPIVVEGYALERLELAVTPAWGRVTTVVRLTGGGAEGVGEDVGYTAAAQDAFQAAGATLDLAGRWTLASFAAHLDASALHPTEPAEPKAPAYRRWAFEAAALDLALRQAGRSFADAVGRPARPVRFVASLGLGRPPTTAGLVARRALYPSIGFKLDASDEWDDALVEELRALGGVTVVDFKEHYGGSFEGAERKSRALYERVAAGLPDALLEDCRVDDETRPLLADQADRVTWDAPFVRADDLDGFPFPPQVLNVKPSRFGTLRAVLDAYDRCEADGVATYGGGQFELGPGRAQLHALAAVFHPDAANDVAPVEWHGELAPCWPSSPLPPADGPGFG